jgi:hypothetical protein
MTENQNVTSNGDSNQQKTRKKNNNYYKKNKNRPYKKPYNNSLQTQSKDCICPDDTDNTVKDSNNQKKTYSKNYNSYKRYRNDKRNSRDLVETVADVKKDIQRIEKEIRLEIEEIKMIRM